MSLFTFFLTSVYGAGQSCQPVSSLLLNPANTNQPGRDGITHTTYSFVDSNGNATTPDPNVAAAFNNAVGQWNALKGTSKVEFDPLPDGQSVPDIQIRFTSDKALDGVGAQVTGGCASYRPATGRIAFGETFLQAAQSTTTGAVILAHELGHALGLDEGGPNPNPPSIMNNPSNPPPGACTSPVVKSTTVQPTDASAIPACSQQARYERARENARARITTRYIYTPLDYYLSVPICRYTYTYYTEDYYVNGQYDSSGEYINGVVC